MIAYLDGTNTCARHGLVAVKETSSLSTRMQEDVQNCSLLASSNYQPMVVADDRMYQLDSPSKPIQAHLSSDLPFR